MRVSASQYVRACLEVALDLHLSCYSVAYSSTSEAPPLTTHLPFLCHVSSAPCSHVHLTLEGKGRCSGMSTTAERMLRKGVLERTLPRRV